MPHPQMLVPNMRRGRRAAGCLLARAAQMVFLFAADSPCLGKGMGEAVDIGLGGGKGGR